MKKNKYMGLKEATHQKHMEAENKEFNKLMFSGQLTPQQYALYLKSQLAIFSALERNFEFPHEGLKREGAVLSDLEALGEGGDLTTDVKTQKYVEYLKGLTSEDAMAHIYLNYLAIMFGGQMMKEATPGPGHMYDFEDMRGSMMAIREIQKDEWADEVNRGFDFMCDIFDELYNQITNV